MADIRVTGLPAATSLQDTDVLHGVQSADDRDKKFTLSDLNDYVGAVQKSGDTMTGALGMPVGSEASPSIYFDANTGLYSPGADQVAIATAGTGRLFVDSNGRLLVGTASDSGGALLQVNGNRIRIATAKTPTSASDTGTAGEICLGADYIYVCTATNTWKRAALSTW